MIKRIKINMRSREKILSISAWFLCGAASLAALISLGNRLLQPGQSENFLSVVVDSLGILYPIPYSIIAALIVSRRSGNVIGWLLMGPVLLAVIGEPISNYINSLGGPPASPDLPFYLMMAAAGWGWLLLVFPVLLIMLLFPTGRPPSARWNWVLTYAGILFTVFIGVTSLSKDMVAIDSSWSVPNPVGLIDNATIERAVPPWQGGLIVLVLACAASLFTRYRRAGVKERNQIKWMAYACGIFAAVYIPGFWITNSDDLIANQVFQVLFMLAIFAFPISIAVAILNDHLWDIDLIINRTLVYGLLSFFLGLVYLGGVALLQQISTSVTGNQSPLAVVLSTLLIAALFNPLHRGVQAFIDRRFYRQKYDSVLALQEFSSAARREVELTRLTSELVGVVEQTVQPEGVWIWMRDENSRTKLQNSHFVSSPTNGYKNGNNSIHIAQ